tara:strand:+ start:63 stop:1451 length:1389 start_codon:yes stop_codon:yes gene_type:complete
MRRKSSKRSNPVAEFTYEPYRRNPIKLGEDSFIDEHMKQIRVGDKPSILGLSEDELRIDGNLFLNGKLSSHIIECDSDYLEFRPNIYTRFESSDYTGNLDLYVASGDSYFTTSGSHFNFITESAGTFKVGSLASSTDIFIFDIQNTKLTIKDDTDTGDKFDLVVAQHGATTISTTDDDAIAGHLTLDIDGDIELNAESGMVYFKDDGVTMGWFEKNGSTSNTFTLNSIIGTANYLRIDTRADGLSTISTVDSDGTAGHLKIAPNGILKTEADDGGISVKETADAGTDTAGYGQLWVHDTTPNELCFTDDAGTDIVGIGKYHYETKFIGYYANQQNSYLPITGYIIEKSSTSSANEFVSFCAPYNATIEKVVFRSEIAMDGAMSFRVLESSDGTEIPGSLIFRQETTVDIADDTYQELDISSPGVGTAYAPLTKGKIYAFFLGTPAISYDTNVTIVFKWDITS